jgi:hypothetical protein
MPHLLLVVLEQLWSLEAHLGCDEVLVNAEGVGLKVKRLGELKALQTRSLACRTRQVHMRAPLGPMYDD